MGINNIGTQGMLRKRLDKYMDYINEDDKVIITKKGFGL